MAGMLITGTMNTIFFKLQNNQSTKDNGKFTHAFFQTFTMFIGEFMCLVVYTIHSYIEKKKHGDLSRSPAMIEAKRKGLKTEINVLLFAIPA